MINTSGRKLISPPLSCPSAGGIKSKMFIKFVISIDLKIIYFGVITITFILRTVISGWQFETTVIVLF
jgi:hypothetical protein